MAEKKSYPYVHMKCGSPNPCFAVGDGHCSADHACQWQRDPEKATVAARCHCPKCESDKTNELQSDQPGRRMFGCTDCLHSWYWEDGSQERETLYPEQLTGCDKCTSRGRAAGSMDHPEIFWCTRQDEFVFDAHTGKPVPKHKVTLDLKDYNPDGKCADFAKASIFRRVWRCMTFS